MAVYCCCCAAGAEEGAPPVERARPRMAWGLRACGLVRPTRWSSPTPAELGFGETAGGAEGTGRLRGGRGEVAGEERRRRAGAQLRGSARGRRRRQGGRRTRGAAGEIDEARERLERLGI